MFVPLGRADQVLCTPTLQLKHLAAVLDVKGRGCWKQGQEMNLEVAISSQLTDAFH